MKKSQKNKIKFAIKIAIRALTPFVCLLVMSAEMFDYSAFFDYLDKVYGKDVERNETSIEYEKNVYLLSDN